MSRSTSVYGLSAEAKKFLDKNCKVEPVETCKTCGHKSGGYQVCFVYDKETGRNAGMFDDGPDLHEYYLKDGTRIKEVVQATPWSSGPCVFLCLERENGERVGEWPQDAIDYC